MQVVRAECSVWRKFEVLQLHSNCVNWQPPHPPRIINIINPGPEGSFYFLSFFSPLSYGNPLPPSL